MRTFIPAASGLLLALSTTMLTAQTDAVMLHLVQGNNTFAFDLYHQLDAKEGNLFFSPYSISSALAMTYAGARGNTEVEMRSVLHFPPAAEVIHPAFHELAKGLGALQDSGFALLAIANSLWPQQEYHFRQDFLNLVQKYYGGTITPVDYGLNNGETAREKINGWVEQQTHNRIKDLIPQGGVNNRSRLTLVNAIYFKGAWQAKFDKKSTKDAPFYASPEHEVKVPLMSQRGKFPYADDEDLQMIELPYSGEGLSMIVLLPHKGTPLSSLESKIGPSHIEMWKRGLRKMTVDVFMPKFTATEEFSLAKVLAKMGMKDAFSPAKADFSGMVASGDQLNISDVLHKAFVDVSEEGTEAAAATSVGMTMISQSIGKPEPIPVFRADHPFIFLIQEKKTGSILFLGRLVNPKE